LLIAPSSPNLPRTPARLLVEDQAACLGVATSCTSSARKTRMMVSSSGRPVALNRTIAHGREGAEKMAGLFPLKARVECKMAEKGRIIFFARLRDRSGDRHRRQVGVDQCGENQTPAHALVDGPIRRLKTMSTICTISSRFASFFRSTFCFRASRVAHSRRHTPLSVKHFGATILTAWPSSPSCRPRAIATLENSLWPSLHHDLRCSQYLCWR
jgi:hypothetical protein